MNVNIDIGEWGEAFDASVDLAMAIHSVRRYAKLLGRENFDATRKFMANEIKTLRRLRRKIKQAMYY